MGNNNYFGLTSKEIEELRKKYGYNELVKTDKPNALRRFIEVFKEPMFLLLIGAATLYFILGEPREGFIMLIFVFFVASITFVQEWKTERTMNSLKSLTSPQVMALRDGKEVLIKSFELVPGDIVLLKEGERIPADCEVLEVSNFSVDESILTGESEPVFKRVSEDNNLKGGYWRDDRLYAGTLSIFGKCTARVRFTGFNTEYGKIGKAIGEVKEERTPLQRKVSSLVKNLAVVGFVLCFLVVMLSYFYNRNMLKSILAGITLAMGIIPEEFPVVLTVFLSLGAFRLAKKNTLMRKVSAVETLGSTTVLCVDKTGTITENNMKIKAIFNSQKLNQASKFNDIGLSKLFVLACEREPYDPMEKAILQLAKENVSLEELFKVPLVHKFSFDSKTKRVANIYKLKDGFYTAVKGSPETVLPLCKIEEDEKQAILNAMDDMAGKGLRVLAFGDGYFSEIFEKLDNYKLEFKGLIGFQDPPKKGIREAIAVCKRAGIRVVMITGDYSKTAVAIGSEIGLKFKDNSITGEDIDRMSEEELCKAVKGCDIFSRVIPEHKMKIIKALKKNAEIVAMTGDGVNDAPALKSADIGIAMGKRGTEVAKEAAHMILMDDNFTTIVHTVEDGRRVFDNIRKAMVYIMIIHIPIIALALFSPIFNLPQILLPAHIMLLELIIDPTCSIVFEGEEAEPYIMEQPPRSPKEPLLTKRMTVKVLLQGIIMFLSAFLPFHFMVDLGYNVDLTRSFSLLTLIISNAVLVLVNRSNTQYLIHIFKERNNKARLLINTLSFIIIICVIYIPFLQGIFKTKALGFNMLLISIALGIISGFWWEAVKLSSNLKNIKS